MCTKQAISWVPLIQMRWTLYGIKLYSMWNNFHVQYFSRNKLHHSQNRATTQIKISVSKIISSKQAIYITRIYTGITLKPLDLTFWNFYRNSIIKFLTTLKKKVFSFEPCFIVNYCMQNSLASFWPTLPKSSYIKFHNSYGP